jgi:hypothetical protein
LKLLKSGVCFSCYLTHVGKYIVEKHAQMKNVVALRQQLAIYIPVLKSEAFFIA